jgi:nucleoside-diphosphate-sugar epimerase
MKILITGGFGYIGSILIEQLLDKGHTVTCFDNLSFGYEHVIFLFNKKNFNFIKGDIRDLLHLKTVTKDQDIIIHLAGIVGYPLCNKDPNLAYEVNVTGTKNVIEACDDSQIIIFASTGSVYGNIEGICTEGSPLNPLTVYSKNKVDGEELFSQRKNSIIFRFATVYGISPRMRGDLLINNFVSTALKKKKLEVYEKHFMRTFISSQDSARVFDFAVENTDKMIGNVYNVGSNSLNYSKEDICNIIKNKISDVEIIYNECNKDEDQRNYVVEYKKINNLGFFVENNLDKDIDSLIKFYRI